MRFCATVLGLASGLAFACPAHSQIASGQWVGEGFFKDAKFTHCGMRARQGQWRIAFSLNPQGALNIGLNHTRLKYTRGVRISGTLQIDKEAPATYQFVAVTAGMVGARLGGAEAIEKFGRGQRMLLHIGEIKSELNLFGLKSAFSQLSTCVAKRGGR